MSKVSRIQPPWTPEQVTQLTRFQRGRYMHPFTCPTDEHEAVLVATETGWECPFDTCDYAQFWAHSFMADPTFMDEHDKWWADLTREARY